MTPADVRVAQRALTQAENIAKELAPVKGSSALQFILHQAKKRSVQAMIDLRDADPQDTRAIRVLQVDAGLFSTMIEFLRDAIAAGDDASQALDELDREELAALVTEDNGPSD